MLRYRLISPDGPRTRSIEGIVVSTNWNFAAGWTPAFLKMKTNWASVVEIEEGFSRQQFVHQDRQRNAIFPPAIQGKKNSGDIAFHDWQDNRENSLVLPTVEEVKEKKEKEEKEKKDKEEKSPDVDKDLPFDEELDDVEVVPENPKDKPKGKDK